MNTETTYNVGDKVRITDLGMYALALLLGSDKAGDVLDERGIKVGGTGTVTEIAPHGTAARVRTDAPEPVDDDGNGWAFYFSQLEKVEG